MSWYSSFATEVPDAAEEFISQAYVEVDLGVAAAESDFRFAVERFDGGPFKLDDMEIAATASFTFETEDVYVVNQVRRGRLRVSQPGVKEELTRGELALVGLPGVKTTTEVADYQQHVVTLDRAALREAAGIEPDSESLPAFTSVLPISVARAASWRRTLSYVGAMLRGDPAIADAPLVIGGANRLLAGLILTTFPSGNLDEPEGGDRRDSHSTSALRRAVAFIEASAELDIGIADIAVAAGMSRRAVQLAFRRHLDTTPTDYLRRVRLDGAHRELLGATGDDRLTVTEVAYRWGFSSPSRFAERYRAAYGVSPSESLRR